MKYVLDVMFKWKSISTVQDPIHYIQNKLYLNYEFVKRQNKNLEESLLSLKQNNMKLNEENNELKTKTESLTVAIFF